MLRLQGKQGGRSRKRCHRVMTGGLQKAPEQGEWERGSEKKNPGRLFRAGLVHSTPQVPYREKGWCGAGVCGFLNSYFIHVEFQP